MSSASFQHLREIGPGMWNIRSSFKMFRGFVDIGTHMSIIRLSSGRFLAIDTIDVPPSLKQEIDSLTSNGQHLEAVIATHPFHTTYFPSFYKIYPNAKYYGTPRHLRNITDIPWAGDVNNESVRKLWEPEVEMRIPAGAEFVNPQPESSNHFSNVFVFHRASRTIHNDDTIIVADHPGLVMSLFGFSDGTMAFHPSMKNVGLLPTPDAPQQFKDWVLGIIRDWDFDNILTAHNGNRIGGAKAELLKTLQKAENLLAKLTEERRK